MPNFASLNIKPKYGLCVSVFIDNNAEHEEATLFSSTPKSANKLVNGTTSLLVNNW